MRVDICLINLGKMMMALPQRDNLIDEIKRTDALLEHAVMNGDDEEAERLREKLKRLTGG